MPFMSIWAMFFLFQDCFWCLTKTVIVKQLPCYGAELVCSYFLKEYIIAFKTKNCMTFYLSAQFKQFVLYYQRWYYIFTHSMTCMDQQGSLSLFSITTMHVVENNEKQQQQNHWGSLVSGNWRNSSWTKEVQL